MTLWFDGLTTFGFDCITFGTYGFMQIWVKCFTWLGIDRSDTIVDEYCFQLFLNVLDSHHPRTVFLFGWDMHGR